MTDQVIYDHLVGKQAIGVYPLLPDDGCHFLAADFNEADWQKDAGAFLQSCSGLTAFGPQFQQAGHQQQTEHEQSGGSQSCPAPVLEDHAHDRDSRRSSQIIP